MQLACLKQASSLNLSWDCTTNCANFVKNIDQPHRPKEQDLLSCRILQFAAGFLLLGPAATDSKIIIKVNIENSK